MLVHNADMKRIAAALASTFALLTGLAVQPAQAMGSGNPYVDQQVGVTYTVYQPTFTAGLKTPTTVANQPDCPTGTEQSLTVPYGSRTALQFTVTEGNPMCSDISTGPTVLTTTIMGARATVKAYCDPATVRTCTKADVRKYGGQLSVTLPAAKGLRPTLVWIETTGRQKLSANQLVRVARSMKPVG